MAAATSHNTGEHSAAVRSIRVCFLSVALCSPYPSLVNPYSKKLRDIGKKESVRKLVSS